MFVDIEGRRCLVVGGGPVATEKVEKLIDHGAVVRLVSPEITPELSEMVVRRRGRRVPRAPLPRRRPRRLLPGDRRDQPRRDQPHGVAGRRGAEPALQRRRRPPAVQLHRAVDRAARRAGPGHLHRRREPGGRQAHPPPARGRLRARVGGPRLAAAGRARRAEGPLPRHARAAATPSSACSRPTSCAVWRTATRRARASWPTASSTSGCPHDGPRARPLAQDGPHRAAREGVPVRERGAGAAARPAGARRRVGGRRAARRATAPRSTSAATTRCAPRTPWPTAIVAHSRMSEDELACARYVLREERAAAQLFRVTSSLDSMVVGESEIQGQVLAAWELAVEEGASGPAAEPPLPPGARGGQERALADAHRRRLVLGPGGRARPRRGCALRPAGPPGARDRRGPDGRGHGRRARAARRPRGGGRQPHRRHRPRARRARGRRGAWASTASPRSCASPTS